MKKLFTALFIGVLGCSTTLSIFSQKIKNPRVRETFAPAKTKTISAPANVKLTYATAYSDGEGVYLDWKAETETGNLGFFVYRLGANGFEPVSDAMIPGGSLRLSETTVSGERYSFFDASGTLKDTYYIESFSNTGQRQSLSQVIPQYLDDLSKVADLSADQLRATKKNAEFSLEESESDLPSELRKQIAVNQLAPNPDTQRWVAGQPGVKIGIKQEGVYRVSRSDLQAAGFDVNVAGNLWQLYADGNEQAIILGANDSYIEFYAKGMDTQESNTRVYYLIAGTQNGLRIETINSQPRRGTSVAANFRNFFTRKERAAYVGSGVLNGEKENFYGSTPVTPTSNPTLTFSLPAVDFTNPKSLIQINLQSLTVGSHQVRATLNGQQLEVMNGFGIMPLSGSFTIPTSILQSGTNTIQFQSLNGASDISLIDSVTINYPRKYEAVQNKLSFYSQNGYKTNVSGFTSPNVRVFDLSKPDRPALIGNASITNNSGNHTVSLPVGSHRVLYALEDSAVMSVSSITQNLPSSLSTPTHNAEMIIVTHRDWMTQANDWATYRRSQGLTVEVVDITDIYDEFSYGAMSTAGMTAFFSYAKSNWQTAPNYVLLLGDATYDFKNYENRAFTSFVPTKLVDTIYEETGSDEALCDFNNDGLAEIAIGRVPARNSQMATLVLNKVTTFESTLNTAWSRGALLVSDLPNGYDFEGVNQRLGTQLPPGIPKTFLNRGTPDARNMLLTAINTGKYLVNYSGHGSTGAWDGGLINVNDAAGMMNAPNYTMFFMLTCLNGYFVRSDSDSLSEAFLKAPNGGAAAAWASSGKTTPDVQETMATRFYSQLSNPNMTRIGDLIKDAKTAVNGGRDVRLSWALIGDPAMKVK